MTLLILRRAVQQSLGIEEVPPAKVLIVVGQGPEQGRWVLHEEMLCDRYAYFRAAFQGGFRETQTKILTMPEDDPKAFGLFVDLMLHVYANIFHHFGNDDEAVQLGLCKAYVLADMLGCQDVAENIDMQYRCYMCPAPTGFLARNVSEEAAQFVLEKTMDDDLLQQTIRQWLYSKAPLWPLASQQ